MNEKTPGRIVGDRLIKSGLLAQAMRWAEEKYSPTCKRKWLSSEPIDPYGNGGSKIHVWVLEGSPARAVIIHMPRASEHEERAVVLGPLGNDKKVFSGNGRRYDHSEA